MLPYSIDEITEFLPNVRQYPPLYLQGLIAMYGFSYLVYLIIISRPYLAYADVIEQLYRADNDLI